MSQMVNTELLRQVNLRRESSPHTRPMQIVDYFDTNKGEVIKFLRIPGQRDKIKVYKAREVKLETAGRINTTLATIPNSLEILSAVDIQSAKKELQSRIRLEINSESKKRLKKVQVEMEKIDDILRR